jgi:hypothetical protein
MGYSVYDFFNDLMKKYKCLSAEDEKRKASKKKKSKAETQKTIEPYEDLDLFKRAFTEMAEYRRKSFIGSLISAEAENSGESEDEVVSDILTEYSEEQLAMIRFRTIGDGEVSSFSINHGLPKGVSLLIKGNG